MPRLLLPLQVGLRIGLMFCFLSPSLLHAEENPASVSPAAAPDVATTVRGRLRERGSRRPLADVNVFLLPQKLKATTDSSGRFEWSDLSSASGEAEVVISAAGYKRLQLKVDLAETRELSIYLERESYDGLETTVRDRTVKRDDTTRSMGQETFLTVPGAQGDPVKAVQNLPGVARTSVGGAQVIIQGSAPEDTSYQIDEQEVPLIFHFGGLTSVITPEAVESVDYLSAGFGVEHGRAMGGIVSLKTREPTRERTKGFAFADTAKAGGLIEGPWGEKSSYLITGRYSYIGYVLQAVLKDSKDQFDLTVAPSFADLGIVFQTKPTAQDEVKVSTIGSRDQLQFLFKEPLRTNPEIRGTFNNETTFYRVIPQWTHRESEDRATRVSAGFGQDFVRVDVGDKFFDLKVYNITQRAEEEWRVNESWKSYVGMSNAYTKAAVSLRLPSNTESGGVRSAVSSSSVQEISLVRRDISLAPYWRNTIHVPGSAWTTTPSLRLDYYSSTHEALPAPRLAVRYSLSDTLHWRAAAGWYTQPPEPQEVDGSFGNPDIKSPRALHLTTGVEKDFREGSSRGFTVNTGPFYKQFYGLVVSSSKTIFRGGELVPEKYSNSGGGRAYGWETLLKAEFAPYSGWVSYTLSKATRTDPSQSSEYLFQYDQTHNINIVAAVDLPRNWKASTRFRYVTGNPRTPVTGGVFDSDNDVYVPIRGPYYSERLSPFMQLDLRFDKKWVFDTWLLSGYLDIQNVTNRKNPEAIRYAYDYSETRTVDGLGLFPTLGLRGDF